MLQRTIRKPIKYSKGFQSKLMINNEFVNASDNKTFQTINPADETHLADVASASKSDVDQAVDAARTAFDKGPWRRTDPSERGRLLYKLAELIEKNRDELATLESLDNGKPKELANGADVQLAIDQFKYYAGWADKIYGETLSVNGDFHAYTRKEPVGVVGQIIPWNFPILMMAWKLAPALACGTTVVMKPAENTSLTCLRIGELIIEAGFPPGVVNLVPGLGPEAGDALVKNKNVDKIAFTGSTKVGFEIMRNAHDDNLKRITLELGGKSPHIIMDDADIDQAVFWANLGIFFNQGQCCIAGSRVFVHEKIHDQFLEKSIEVSKKMKIGNPLDAETTHGPQVSKIQMEKILSFIDSGKKQGATVETGGEQVGDKGFFVAPTIFSGVEDHMEIAEEEIFGPVMSVLKFSSIEEVIERANNNRYGLGAGVSTKSLDNALHLTNGLQAGTVYVNCYDIFQAGLPFGGYKDSGIGREMGHYALNNYLETKTVVMKRPEGSLP